MILRDKPGLFDVLFALRGLIVPHIWRRVAFVTLAAAGVVWASRWHPELFAAFNAAPFTLLGISLSIFLSFRNNACYDRWWEGRKLWGQLVVEARSFARESVIIADAEQRRRLLRALAGLAYGLAASLRGHDAAAASRPYLPAGLAIGAAPNPINAIVDFIGRELSDLARTGAISEWRYQVLEARLIQISAVQAGCERIFATPLPFAYSLLLHRTSYVFCLLLPVGIAGALGWATPVLVALVSYTFFGLDALGDELEDPFGTEGNDLPLSALAVTIERDLLAAAGETDLPAAAQPVNFNLR